MLLHLAVAARVAAECSGGTLALSWVNHFICKPFRRHTHIHMCMCSDACMSKAAADRGLSARVTDGMNDYLSFL